MVSLKTSDVCKAIKIRFIILIAVINILQLKISKQTFNNKIKRYDTVKCLIGLAKVDVPKILSNIKQSKIQKYLTFRGSANNQIKYL